MIDALRTDFICVLPNTCQTTFDCLTKQSRAAVVQKLTYEKIYPTIVVKDCFRYSVLLFVGMRRDSELRRHAAIEAPNDAMDEFRSRTDIGTLLEIAPPAD